MYFFFVAETDYRSASAVKLTFDSTTRSANFSVDILQDTVTDEPMEFFEVFLTGVTLLDGISGTQPSLSTQEHGHILFSPGQARVNIRNCKSTSPIQYVLLILNFGIPKKHFMSLACSETCTFGTSHFVLCREVVLFLILFCTKCIFLDCPL